MTNARRPSLDEVVLGAFLEDIGKFMQRAHSGNNALPREVMNRASVVLPSFRGRSSHWHALWSDAFFHELERRGTSLPGGLDLNAVRESAVYHHSPSTPLHWLSAEADRLSAGMDRKPRDEESELQDAATRGGFRRIALQSVFASVNLERGGRRSIDPHLACYRVGDLSPEALLPGRVDETAQMEGYQDIWPSFLDGFQSLCRDAPTVALFHEGVLSLSERLTWAIPSSTVDQPDVPLHDHNKSVAAVAACLYRFHEARGELDDSASIRDRAIPKFRFLVGDLSGIQTSLFRLASQQVKGAARILRARSFLMAATVEAVSLACRRRLGLPPYCELLAAGGRFLLLVPVSDSLESDVDGMRAEIDSWLADRYLGDLTLNLALGRPLAGLDLMQGRFGDALEDVNRVVAEAKLQPLRHVATGVLPAPYVAETDGACAACGVRPATENAGGIRRCKACHDAYEIGARLPHAVAVVLSDGPLPSGIEGAGRPTAMPCGLSLAVLTQSFRTDDADAWRRVVSGYRLSTADAPLPPARRHIANHVPRLGQGDTEDPRYGDLDPESRAAVAGDIKTFAHIAADSKETTADMYLVGRAMLAVIKADVDRLGQIFSRGLGNDLSLGRLATMSRMTDAFFTVVLPDLFTRKFPSTYTVYAGGDDLLLLGPWYDAMQLADAIAEAFHAHVAKNPDITLSAGIEFCSVHEPINRAVHRAERRLETAKDEGRNKVCAVIPAALSWPDLRAVLADADIVSCWMRDRQRPLPTAFVYRTLQAARERDRAEDGTTAAAGWRGQWAYAISRSFDRKSDEDNERLRFFDRLLGSGLTATDAGCVAAAVAALTIALYRNR